jgi:cyclophilin family peptidyl-prolyl cis-trans isomerase
MKKLFTLIFILGLFVSCGQKDETTESTTDDIVVISTDFGEIYMALYDETPKHKENFLKLAREGFYDSTTFHRVMENFMIQGGDPNSKDEIPFNDGQGGPGYTLEAEFLPQFIHKKGALAAARLGDQQNPEKRSSGSQFYIVHGKEVNDAELDQVEGNVNNMMRQELIRDYVQRPENADILNKLREFNSNQQLDSLQALLLSVEPEALVDYEVWEYSPEQRSAYQTLGGYPFLDQNYTIFGEVIEGLSVVDSIAVQEKDQRNRPFENIEMKVRVETLDKDEITKKYGYTYQ